MEFRLSPAPTSIFGPPAPKRLPESAPTSAQPLTPPPSLASLESFMESGPSRDVRPLPPVARPVKQLPERRTVPELRAAEEDVPVAPSTTPVAVAPLPRLTPPGGSGEGNVIEGNVIRFVPPPSPVEPAAAEPVFAAPVPEPVEVMSPVVIEPAPPVVTVSDPRAEAELPTKPLTDQQVSRVREALATVEPRVAELVEAGLEAGRRKAAYTAQQRLRDALRLLAQTADSAAGRDVRQSRLERGLLALEESADFAAAGGLETLSPPRIVAKHHSQVTDAQAAEGTTHVQLQRAYLEFAQRELAAAAEGSRAGSEALLGLAKFHLQRAETDGLRREGPRAVALCQAALVVDERNHGAANELGALLAKYGRLEDARSMLRRSVRSQPSRAAWHNLAVVHERLGEQDLAIQARQELERLDAAEQDARREQVQWLDNRTFAGTYRGPAGGSVSEPAETTASRPTSASLDRWSR